MKVLIICSIYHTTQACLSYKNRVITKMFMAGFAGFLMVFLIKLGLIDYVVFSLDPGNFNYSHKIILVLLPRFSEWQYDWMRKVYLNVTPYAMLLDNQLDKEKRETSQILIRFEVIIFSLKVVSNKFQTQWNIFHLFPYAII